MLIFIPCFFFISFLEYLILFLFLMVLYSFSSLLRSSKIQKYFNQLIQESFFNSTREIFISFSFFSTSSIGKYGSRGNILFFEIIIYLSLLFKENYYQNICKFFDFLFQLILYFNIIEGHSESLKLIKYYKIILSLFIS